MRAENFDKRVFRTAAYWGVLASDSFVKINRINKIDLNHFVAAYFFFW